MAEKTDTQLWRGIIFLFIVIIILLGILITTIAAARAVEQPSLDLQQKICEQLNLTYAECGQYWGWALYRTNVTIPSDLLTAANLTNLVTDDELAANLTDVVHKDDLAPYATTTDVNGTVAALRTTFENDKDTAVKLAVLEYAANHTVQTATPSSSDTFLADLEHQLLLKQLGLATGEAASATVTNATLPDIVATKDYVNQRFQDFAAQYGLTPATNNSVPWGSFAIIGFFIIGAVGVGYFLVTKAKAVPEQYVPVKQQQYLPADLLADAIQRERERPRAPSSRRAEPREDFDDEPVGEPDEPPSNQSDDDERPHRRRSF